MGAARRNGAMSQTDQIDPRKTGSYLPLSFIGTASLVRVFPTVIELDTPWKLEPKVTNPRIQTHRTCRSSDIRAAISGHTNG